MAFSLYDASVANYLQALGAVGGFLERARTHAAEHKIDLATLNDARLAPDMWSLRQQVIAVAHHSAGAIEGVKAGLFQPPNYNNPLDYAGLQALVKKATDDLTGLSRVAVDAFQGRDMVFQLGERKLPFTAENFLMSFSLPNFYFHATTAYDILRSKGVPLGKRDFMGKLRIKT